MTLVKPKSNALLTSSKSAPWSRCTQAGTLALSPSANMAGAIFSRDTYSLCAAFANCKITGCLSSSAASITALIPSSVVRLNAPIAIFSASAIPKTDFNVTNINYSLFMNKILFLPTVLYLIFKYTYR